MQIVKQSFTIRGAFFPFFVAAFVYFLYVAARYFIGEQSVFQDFVDGVGVELIGGLLTFIGLLSLQRIYDEPSAEMKPLQEQVQRQSEQIEALRAELHTTLTELRQAENNTQSFRVIV